MKANKSDPHAPDPRREENDPLWQLLGEAPLPPPDAWFAVRTLARCRYEGAPRESWRFAFSTFWRRALGGVLGLGLAVGLMVAQMQIHSGPVVADKTNNVQEAFEIMASVNPSTPDADTASTSSSWQDSSQ